MQQFLENNWLSVLSILIGIVVAYVFYRLQKKDSASASAERLKHATTELLDVVESYIINKQRLSEGVIENLIYASERDHKVALRPGCTAESLLQDVALRLQRSRHLDIPQKTEYSEKIDKLIVEIRGDQAPSGLDDLSDEIAARLAELERLLPPDRRHRVQEILAAVARMADQQRVLSARSQAARERLRAATTTFAGVGAALATTLIGSRELFDISNSSLNAVVVKILPVMGFTLAAVVALQAFNTILRIKKRQRGQNQSEDSGE